MMIEQERRSSREECERRTRTVFVPHEFQGSFTTMDRELYRRKANGAIVHAGPRKTKGKAARREEKRRRQAQRAERKRDEQLAAIAAQVCECQPIEGVHTDGCPVTIAENFKRRAEGR